MVRYRCLRFCAAVQICRASPPGVVVVTVSDRLQRMVVCLACMKEQTSVVYTHRVTQEFADNAFGRRWKSETDSCFAEERHVRTCLFCNAVYVSIREAKISVALDE